MSQFKVALRAGVQTSHVARPSGTDSHYSCSAKSASEERCTTLGATSFSISSSIPGTCTQYPGGGALGDASTPGTRAGSIAASAHRRTYSHVAAAGGARGGERRAAAATAAAAARRRGATPTSGAVTPPRSAPAHGRRGGRHGARPGGWDRPPRDKAPLTAPIDGVSNRRRAAATEAGAEARSPAGDRGRFEPRKSLRAVAARNSGQWVGAGGQAPSGPRDLCGRTVLLSHEIPFAFSVRQH